MSRVEKNFFMGLMNPKDDRSMKRFISLFSFALIAFAWVIALIYKDRIVPEYYYYGMTGLLMATLGYTVIEKMRQKASSTTDEPKSTDNV